jgi:GTP-binding protein SAR1
MYVCIVSCRFILLFCVVSIIIILFASGAQELVALCKSVDLSNVPILILANKIDIPGSLTREQLTKGLDLDNLKIYHNIQMFMISIVQNSGYEEGFNWLSQQL